MRHQTGSNFKLGLMVTAALLIFITAVYLIGSNQSMFGDTFRISAVFKNVNGLQSGNNVRFAGINVGTVDKIVIISDSTVEVHMKVNNGVRNFIKKDAVAGIGSDGLVGNMLINISPGSGDFPPVDHQDRIASYSRADTDNILSTLNSTNENIAILSRDLLTTTKYINEGQGTITALLKDSALLTSLKSSITNLEVTTANSVAITEKLHKMSHKLENQHNLVNLLLSDTSITSDFEQVVQDLDKSSKNLYQVSTELQKATAAINQDSIQGPINALLYDSTITNELKTTIHNISQGTVLLNENLEAMRQHFLFRKYFKKQNKHKKAENTDTQFVQ